MIIIICDIFCSSVIDETITSALSGGSGIVLSSVTAEVSASTVKAISSFSACVTPVSDTGTLSVFAGAAPQPAAAQDTALDNKLAMKLHACVSGKLIDISEVKDDMFSQKMMGDGIAIEPTGDTVVAPADAEVTMIMEESLHAIGLRFANGAEILIHIGIDTVKLNGEGFQALVKAGDKVKSGSTSRSSRMPVIRPRSSWR